MIVYFDNNIYNYMVDGVTISAGDVARVVSAVTSGRLKVLFSPVNLTEVVRCFESKPKKGRKMVDLSLQLSPRVTLPPDGVMAVQIKHFLAGKDPLHSDPFPDGPSLFDEVRAGISGEPRYKIPDKFHDAVKRWDGGYVDSLRKMKTKIDELLNEESRQSERPQAEPIAPAKPVDIYRAINSEPVTRRRILEDIARVHCGIEADLSAVKSFDAIPCLSVFLRYHFQFALDLVAHGKEPKSGDWADRDQTVYFCYADYVVTSDTGGDDSPNYRAIVSQALQPLKRSAVRFSTFASKLP